MMRISAKNSLENSGIFTNMVNHCFYKYKENKEVYNLQNKQGEIRDGFSNKSRR